MFLNTFVQKHINSKYSLMYCSCVRFFSCSVFCEVLSAIPFFRNPCGSLVFSSNNQTCTLILKNFAGKKVKKCDLDMLGSSNCSILSCICCSFLKAVK